MMEQNDTIKVNDKKYFVTIEGQSQEFEVPVYAVSLDDALEQAEWTYQPAGFQVTRVRPASKV